MWSAGGPMAAPGSSGHMQPGAPFPGPMGPPQAGMHSYGGQMPLPYGQMEGNHAMYDQRMIPNRAGRPGTMPDYPQVPMGQAPWVIPSDFLFWEYNFPAEQARWWGCRFNIQLVIPKCRDILHCSTDKWWVDTKHRWVIYVLKINSLI